MSAAERAPRSRDGGDESRGARERGAGAGGADGTPDASEPEVVRRADYDPDYDPDAPVLCEICGSVMEYTASCKLVCRNCGYTRDCSDP